jgi:peroxiredoxin
MRRRSGVLILLALLLGGALALRALLPPAPSDEQKTDTLFAARFADAHGQLQSISQWRGQWLIVNFWASWCPPCLEEMPELSDLQDQYSQRGMVVLGITTDDAAKMQEFGRANPVSYPLLAGDFAAMQLAEQLGNDKGILPFTVVLRPDGSVALRYFGRLDIKKLEHTLTALLSHSG